jgi:hypothetical protein
MLLLRAPSVLQRPFTLAFWGVIAATALLGCGSTAQPVQEVDNVPLLPMPDECTGSSEGCLPAADWGEAVCQGVYPEVALYMLRGGTPWQRLYMTARMQPFNASGGVSVLDGLLEPGEELIALRRLGSSSVSRTEGYEALRWDGSCVTLHDGEYSFESPPRLRHARVEWPKLSASIQRVLRGDDDVDTAFRVRRKECKGAYFGPVSDKCVVRDRQFVEAIVKYIRSGPQLPTPRRRPPSTDVQF